VPHGVLAPWHTTSRKRPIYNSIQNRRISWINRRCVCAFFQEKKTVLCIVCREGTYIIVYKNEEILCVQAEKQGEKKFFFVVIFCKKPWIFGVFCKAFFAGISCGKPCEKRGFFPTKSRKIRWLCRVKNRAAHPQIITAKTKAPTAKTDGKTQKRKIKNEIEFCLI